MASENRQSNINIKELLLTSGNKFSFIQANRLLNLLTKEEQASLQEQLRIRPELSLEFPGSDVASIEEVATENGSRYLLTATFLGLYGVSSPLPTFYTENLFQEAAEDNSLNREFIDIFNNHLYHSFFKIWSTHRLGYKLFEEKDNSYMFFLYSFGGLTNENVRNNISSEYNPLRYLGILGHFPRSAYGLKTLLSDLLNLRAIKIIECQDSLLPIPEDQQFSLGINNCQLGENSHLGKEITSTNNAFTIQIGPISYDDYSQLLPNSEKFKLLHQSVNLYIDQPLIWDVELSIPGEEIPGITLGKINGAQLGYDSWLLDKKASRKVIYNVRFDYIE